MDMKRTNLGVHRWKLAVSLLMLIIIAGLTGCGAKTEKEDIPFSENILLSLNHGAPGYGTIEECIDAEIYIYTDRTVKVVVYYPEELEIASLELTEADYEKIVQLADPHEISSLKVEEDLGVCDGSSYYLSRYGENDEQVLSRGGYMPIGKKFWEIRDGIMEILKPYGITEIVEDYRKSAREILNEK